jgi:hypothetical protein
MRNNQATSTAGVLIYVLGVVAGILLITISTWADMEADYYGFQRRANTRLGGLVCPILLTRHETGIITLKVSNPTDAPLYPSIRTEISAEFDPPIFIESIDLAPGESERLEWPVGPENIDLGNFILANVQVYASYPIPNREKTCGILIIDRPGSGRVIVTALFAFSLLGLGGGLYLMSRSDFRRRRATNVWSGIIFLTALILSGLILSFMGYWLPASAILAMSVLISLFLISSLIVG